MTHIVGSRVTEQSLQLGQMYPAPAALKIGLVDQLVTEDKVQSTAAAVMAQWLAVPGKNTTSGVQESPLQK